MTFVLVSKIKSLFLLTDLPIDILRKFVFNWNQLLQTVFRNVKNREKCMLDCFIVQMLLGFIIKAYFKTSQNENL